jgi:hypothetical protein
MPRNETKAKCSDSAPSVQKFFYSLFTFSLSKMLRIAPVHKDDETSFHIFSLILGVRRLCSTLNCRLMLNCEEGPIRENVTLSLQRGESEKILCELNSFMLHVCHTEDGYPICLRHIVGPDSEFHYVVKIANPKQKQFTCVLRYEDPVSYWPRFRT